MEILTDAITAPAHHGLAQIGWNDGAQAGPSKESAGV